MYEVWGGWAITAYGIKKNYSLAIEKDRIVDMGPTREMRDSYSFEDSIGKERNIICPGFVDAHMHSFQLATKGLTADQSLLEWLKKYIWRWEADLDKEKARACAEVSYLQMIRCGVTSISDYASVHHVDEAFLAAKRFGIRALIGKTLMDRNSPPELEQETDICLKESEALIRKWHGKNNGLLNYAVTPRFAITSTDALLRGCRELCEKYNLVFRTHSEENFLEVKEERKLYGQSIIRHLDKLGLLNERALLTHCVWTKPAELKLIARRGASVSHCPGSNMMLASGFADTPQMLKYGINVCLGSDVAGYYNFSMFEQARLACLMQKARLCDPHAMDHEKAFRMATANGAKALGFKDAGELKPGNKADVITLSTHHLAFSPLNDIISQIVYSAFPSSVNNVICNGKPLMRERKLLIADVNEIMERAQEVMGSGLNVK
ncbi:MAG: amidohydrolase family protein [Candidatus Bilamarchaeaceae archaeon]